MKKLIPREGIIMQQKKCYNCKFATKQFKAGGMSHVHCQNETLYPSKDFENGKLSVWDTLMEWWGNCEKWEERVIDL